MSTDAFREHLAKLNAEYQAALPARLAEIEALWSAASAAPGAAMTEPMTKAMTELRRLLHSMAGSAKTFGLPAVGAAAREAEHCIEQFCADGARPGALPTAAERARVAELLVALRSVAGS